MTDEKNSIQKALNTKKAEVALMKSKIEALATMLKRIGTLEI